MEPSRSLNILVVEDESFIAEMIKVMLLDMGHKSVQIALNQSDAEQILNRGEVDFAIFDMNLQGGMEGLELAKATNALHTPFMFLTSYSDRRTIEDAKLTKPGAYVIKPFREDELFAGIEMTLMHAFPDNEGGMVALKVSHETIMVKLSDIAYAKADNIYVEVHVKEKRHLIRKSLSAFLDELPEGSLLRVHRSYAVNPEHVKSIRRASIGLEGIDVPISRSYREQVMQVLKR